MARPGSRDLGVDAVGLDDAGEQPLDAFELAVPVETLARGSRKWRNPSSRFFSNPPAQLIGDLMRIARHDPRLPTDDQLGCSACFKPNAQDGAARADILKEFSRNRPLLLGVA